MNILDIHRTRLVDVSTRTAVGYFTLGLTLSSRPLLPACPAVGLATGGLSQNGKNMSNTKYKQSKGVLKDAVSTQIF